MGGPDDEDRGNNFWKTGWISSKGLDWRKGAKHVFAPEKTVGRFKAN